MILLDAENQIVLQTLQKRFDMAQNEPKKERLKNKISFKVQEFDQTKINIESVGLETVDGLDSQKESMKISVFVECGDVAKSHGLEDYFKKIYGNYATETEAGMTATILVPIDDADEKERDLILKEAPLIKRYVMMSPFMSAFDSYVKGEKITSIHLPYRAEENIYIVQLEKSLTIVYSIKFDHQDDVILGKVFLQEFKDARRQDKSLGAAPSVTFSQGQLPQDLQGMKTTEPKDLSGYGFVSLTLREAHCTEKQRYDTIDKLLQFRNYFQYHLKCSKAFMHIRMRSRLAALLKELEEAKDTDGIEIKKKTFSGKTFTK
eukprot:gene10556-3075_t